MKRRIIRWLDMPTPDQGITWLDDHEEIVGVFSDRNPEHPNRVFLVIERQE